MNTTLRSTTVSFIIPSCPKPVKGLPLTTLDTSFKKTLIPTEMGHQRVSSNRFRISEVRFPRFDTRSPCHPQSQACHISFLPVVADPGSWQLAAECYSSPDSVEGGNLQIGFRTLRTRVPAFSPPSQVWSGFQGKVSQCCGLDVYQQDWLGSVSILGGISLIKAVL